LALRRGAWRGAAPDTSAAVSTFVLDHNCRENNPFMHTTSDTTDKIDFAHSAEVAHVALGYAVELGYVVDVQTRGVEE